MLPYGYGRLDVDIEVDRPQKGDCGYLDEEQTKDVLEAALIYKTEVAAVAYIARAEQSYYGLTNKLLKKGYDESTIKVCLEYLKSINYINDERYALSWLRSRSINHAEGKIRLQAELCSRGIDKKTAQKALDNFFCDKDELELCTKAYKKCIRTLTDKSKIYSSLMRKGFSYTVIKKVMKMSL